MQSIVKQNSPFSEHRPQKALIDNLWLIFKTPVKVNIIGNIIRTTRGEVRFNADFVIEKLHYKRHFVSQLSALNKNDFIGKFQIRLQGDLCFRHARRAIVVIAMMR